MKNINYDDTQIMCHTRWEEELKKLEKITERCFGIKKSDFSTVVATVSGEEKKSMGFKASKKVTFPFIQIPIGAQYSAEDVWFIQRKMLFWNI